MYKHSMLCCNKHSDWWLKKDAFHSSLATAVVPPIEWVNAVAWQLTLDVWINPLSCKAVNSNYSWTNVTSLNCGLARTVVQKKKSINKSAHVCPRRCALFSDKGRQKPYLDVLFFDFQRKGGLEAAQLPPAGPNLPLRLLMCSQNTDSSSTSCFSPHMVRACSITFVSIWRKWNNSSFKLHTVSILSYHAFAMSFCEKSCHSIHSIHSKLLIAKLPNVPCVQALMPAGPGQIRFGHQPRVGVQIFVPPVPSKLRGFINFGLNW